MRKYLKNSLLEIFRTLYEAHVAVRELLKKEEYNTAVSVLGDCQDTAVKIGGYVEESEGEDCPLISLLLKYCEELYHVSENLTEISSVKQLKNKLDKALFTAEDYLKNEIKVKLEVVFLPYKASMWNTLESVWKAADEDPECNAYVIPIPYYDRNPDHSFGQFHYEGDKFPSEVPVINYKLINLEKLHPDIIYIHNPYDGYNYVTSVLPAYYSDQIKKYTDLLVYIPYGVNIEFDAEQIPSIDHIPAINNIDKVILPSKLLLERINKIYEGRNDIINKYEALGSPAVDIIVTANKNQFNMPDEWLNIIKNKKIVLFDVTLGIMLSHSDEYIQILSDTFEFFDNNSEYALWWRPHPLTESTMVSMRPGMIKRYSELKAMYITKKVGIYDDTSDMLRAVTFCDYYYGSKNSGVNAACSFAGKITVSLGYAKDDIKSANIINDFPFNLEHNATDNSDLSVLKKLSNFDGKAGYSIHNEMKCK